MLNLTISIGYITLIIALAVILFGGRLFVGFGKDNMTTQEKQMREDTEYLIGLILGLAIKYNLNHTEKFYEIANRYNIDI